MAPAEPTCPKCEIKGRGFIEDQKSVQESEGGDPWFVIVFCGNCGHIYGVFPKVILSPSRFND